MFNILNKFNFSDSLVKWIKLFYKSAKATITNNGYISKFFKIEKGVREGCPLSPYLFILSIGLLSVIVNETTI